MSLLGGSALLLESLKIHSIWKCLPYYGFAQKNVKYGFETQNWIGSGRMLKGPILKGPRTIVKGSRTIIHYRFSIFFRLSSLFPHGDKYTCVYTLQ